MTIISTCPDVAALESFARGQRSLAEAEALAVHMDQCPLCAEAVERLLSLDTLTDALRKETLGSPDPAVPALEQLVERIQSLLPMALASDHTRAAIPDDAGPTTVLPEQEPRQPITEALYDFLAPPQQPGELGRLGGYRVMKVLGSGGMGVVFQAEDPQLGRLVALKAMLPALAASAGARQRFLREARAAAAVKHDNIVAIYQVGEDRGVPFLAMEFLEGQPLDRRLEHHARLPVMELLRIGREIATGLVAAHQRGLVHRDIKPANIWLETSSEFGIRNSPSQTHESPGNGAVAAGPELADSRLPIAHSNRVKILDFGLARASKGEAQLTQAGAIIGTPGYMAPEQAQGYEADARADLFSLGCVLYRLATGVAPFQGNDAISTLLAVTSKVPRPPHELSADLPRPLSDVILRLLAKNPAERPASAREVVESLAALEATQRFRESKDETLRPLPPRRRWAVAAGLVLALAVAVAVVVIIRDESGKEIARLKLADGTQVEVRKHDAPPPVPGKTIEKTEPRPAIAQPGQPAAGRQVFRFSRPLGPSVLVQRPSVLPGARSWTLETARPRSRGLNYIGDDLETASLSADGRQLASLGMDCTLRIYDAETGHLQKVLIDDSVRIGGCAWSPDGKLLLAKGRAVWDVATSRLRYQVAEPNPHFACWSPDGTRFVTRGRDPGSNMAVWEAATGRLLHQTSSVVVSGGAWSPLGDRLALVGNGTIILWDIQSRKVVRECRDPAVGLYTRPVWSPDGRTLMAFCGGSAVVTVKRWNTETGQALPVPAKWAGVLCGSYSPDGKTLALGTRTSIELCEPASGDVIRSIPYVGLRKNESSLAWSHDGMRLICSHAELQGAVVLDIASGQPRCQVAAYPNWRSHSWSPDGQKLTVAAFTPVIANDTVLSEIRSWDLSSGRQDWQMNLGKSSVPVAAHSPDGKTLAMAHLDPRRVILYHAASLTRRGELDQAGGLSGVTALSWSRDGKRIGAADRNGVIRVWDAPSRKVVYDLPGKKTPVSALAWAPDGKTLAAGVASDTESNRPDNRIELWPLDGEHPEQAVPRQIAMGIGVVHLSWSPDGTELACQQGRPTQWRIFDPKTGKLVRDLGVFYGTPGWSSDSSIKVLNANAELTQWGRDSVRPTGLAKLNSFSNVNAFSPDSRIVAMAGRSSVPNGTSSTLWLRKTSNGEPMGTLVMLDRERWLAVSPEGHYRASGNVEKELVYVVENDDGRQETLTPAAFAQRFHWTNDPEKVRNLADGTDRFDVESFAPPSGAVVLCDGSSLGAWLPSTASLNGAGAMQAGRDDVTSKEAFGGRFKLHVEFRVPTRTDPKIPSSTRCGVLVQGRYLLCIADSHDAPFGTDICGAISGIKAPDIKASRPAGAWQSLEVTFEPPTHENGKVTGSPRLTVWHNDFMIHDKINVRPTARSYDEKVSEPGPIVLLGNEDGVQFRNVWLLPGEK